MKTMTWLAAFLVFTFVAAHAEPVVSIDPSSSKVRVGDTFTVDITMTGSPVTEGGGVSLKFNSDVVQATSVTVNTGTWSFASQTGTIDNDTGFISDIVFARYPGGSGDGLIATVQFEAIDNGRTRLKLQQSELNPFASGGLQFAVQLKKGIVRVRKARN